MIIIGGDWKQMEPGVINMEIHQSQHPILGDGVTVELVGCYYVKEEKERMGEKRSIQLIGILTLIIVLIVAGIGVFNSSKEVELTTVPIERDTERSTQQIREESLREEIYVEEPISEINSVAEEEPAVFVYMYGNEYDEDKIPRRFGYVVEENIKEREVPLREEDFNQLKKGEIFYPSRSPVGMPDGSIMYTKRAEGTGEADTSAYYKIDNNTYVVLFYKHNFRIHPLDHIEVWDGEGNKLREIELD